MGLLVCEGFLKKVGKSWFFGRRGLHFSFCHWKSFSKKGATFPNHGYPSYEPFRPQASIISLFSEFFSVRSESSILYVCPLFCLFFLGCLELKNIGSDLSVALTTMLIALLDVKESLIEVCS